MARLHEHECCLYIRSPKHLNYTNLETVLVVVDDCKSDACYVLDFALFASKDSIAAPLKNKETPAALLKTKAIKRLRNFAATWEVGW